PGGINPPARQAFKPLPRGPVRRPRPYRGQMASPSPKASRFAPADLWAFARASSVSTSWPSANGCLGTPTSAILGECTRIPAHLSVCRDVFVAAGPALSPNTKFSSVPVRLGSVGLVGTCLTESTNIPLKSPLQALPPAIVNDHRPPAT